MPSDAPSEQPKPIQATVSMSRNSGQDVIAKVDVTYPISANLPWGVDQEVRQALWYLGIGVDHSPSEIVVFAAEPLEKGIKRDDDNKDTPRSESFGLTFRGEKSFRPEWTLSNNSRRKVKSTVRARVLTDDGALRIRVRATLQITRNADDFLWLYEVARALWYLGIDLDVTSEEVALTIPPPTRGNWSNRSLRIKTTWNYPDRRMEDPPRNFKVTIHGAGSYRASWSASPS